MAMRFARLLCKLRLVVNKPRFDPEAIAAQRLGDLNGGGGGRPVRFGSKADIRAAKSHVRFTPNSDRKSGFPHKVMSALPPKADMCSALAYVCFGHHSGHCAASIEQRVGALQKRFWNCEPYGLRSLEIDDQLELRRLLNR
jgi:hypothetical protein